MNRKGQLGVGIMVIAAIALIAGLVLYQEVNKTIGDITTTVIITNRSTTMAAVNSTVEIPGCQAASANSITFSNRSGVAEPNIAQANFTVTSGVSPTDSTLALLIKTKDASVYAGQPVNVSFICEPDGYITSAGGRSIALLIVIFSALAIAVTALVPTLRNGVLDMLG